MLAALSHGFAFYKSLYKWLMPLLCPVRKEFRIYQTELANNTIFLIK